MKKNKIKLLAISLVILIALVGCTPAKTNNVADRNNRLTTQTRIGENNGWTRDDMNTGMNNGLNDGWNRGMNNGLNNDSNNNGMLGDNANNINPMNNDLNNGMTRSNDTNMTNTGMGMGNMTQNASEIAKKISALPEVNSAQVVLTNDTAVVGCNLRGTTQGTMTNALRQKIEKIVKDDSNITKVSVTSDPDLYKRIQTMSTGIGSGRMTDTFTNDINDVIRKIKNVGTDVNNIGR